MFAIVYFISTKWCLCSYPAINTCEGNVKKRETIIILTSLSSLAVPGMPWHTQILADQLTLFQPWGTDYAHLITTGTPGFSDLPTALLK